MPSGNYETRSSKLTDENAKCRVEFERSCNYLRLVAAYSKIARTSVKVRKNKLLSLEKKKTIVEKNVFSPIPPTPPSSEKVTNWELSTTLENS